jgi:hypothetical protein
MMARAPWRTAVESLMAAILDILGRLVGLSSHLAVKPLKEKVVSSITLTNTVPAGSHEC